MSNPEQQSQEALDARSIVLAQAANLKLWPEVKVHDEDTGQKRMYIGIPIGLRKSEGMLFQPNIYDLLTPDGIFAAGVHNDIGFSQGGIQYLPSVRHTMPEVAPDVYKDYKEQAIRIIEKKREIEDGEMIKNAWTALSG